MKKRAIFLTETLNTNTVGMNWCLILSSNKLSWLIILIHIIVVLWAKNRMSFPQMLIYLEEEKHLIILPVFNCT